MFEIRTFGVTSPSFHNLKTPRHISAISASLLLLLLLSRPTV